MFTSAPYARRFFHRFQADNGLRWLLSFDALAYSGPAIEIQAGPQTGSAVLSWATGSGGDAAAPLSPVSPSQCLVRLFPAPSDRAVSAADIAGLGSRPTGHVRLTVYADLATQGTAGAGGRSDLVWAGYLPQGAVSDVPDDPLTPVDLRFEDGLRMMLSRGAVDPTAPGFDPDARRCLVDWLRLWLGPVAGDLALDMVTRTDWRPYTATGDHVPGTTDPMAAVRSLVSAWADGDGVNADVTDQQTATRQTVARMLSRLMFARDRQGRVGWHVTQRGLLCRSAGLDVPTFAYTLSGSDADETPGLRTVETDVIDTLPWDLGQGPGAILARTPRTRDGGMRQVSSRYDFRPNLDNLVSNASFELGSARRAEGWSFNGDAQAAQVTSASATVAARIDLGLDSPEVFTPTFGDEYAVRFTDDRGNVVTPFISQGGMVTLAPYTGGALKVSARLHWFPEAGSGFDPAKQGEPARLSVSVRPPPTEVAGSTLAVLSRGEVASTAAVLKGSAVRVPIAAFLAGEPGAVPGTALIPAGTDLRFNGTDRPTLTLSRDVVVGATEVEGSLSDDLESGAVAGALFFSRDPSRSLGISLFDVVDAAIDGPYTATALDLMGSAALVAVDGSRVAGALTTFVQGARIATSQGSPVADAQFGVETWTLDRVRIEPTARPESAEGRTTATFRAVGSLTYSAARIYAQGYAAGLPVADQGGHVLGDGPLLESVTGLRVSPDGGATIYPTQQGTNSGWVTGAVEDGDTPSGRTIDALTAASALAQTAGRDSEPNGPEVWEGVMQLPYRSQAPAADCLYYPTSVYAVYQVSHLAEPAQAGAGTVALSAPPKPGQRLHIGGETHTVGAVSAGLGVWSADLVDAQGDPATLAQTHARHTRCLYGMATDAVGASWDLGQGRVTSKRVDLAWRGDGTAYADGGNGPATDIVEDITLST